MKCARFESPADAPPGSWRQDRRGRGVGRCGAGGPGVGGTARLGDGVGAAQLHPALRRGCGVGRGAEGADLVWGAGWRVGRGGGRWGRDSEQTSSAPAPAPWITGQDRGARERRLRGKRAVGNEGLARDLDLSPHGGRPWGTVCHYHSQLEAPPPPPAWGLGEVWAASKQELLGGGGRSICLRLWLLRLRTPDVVLGLS